MTANDDSYALLPQFKHLRVVDVADALDGMGYFDIGLVSPEVRPLFPDIRFWGVAVTLRCVPANRPMWRLDNTADIVNAHGIWFREAPPASVDPHVRAGSVIVMDAGDSGEVGFWGSNNALAMVVKGAVGIVTDGCARDTAELRLQGTPICARQRARTIIPGRIQAIEVQTPISCGGAQVRPGDIVGCDDDGVIVAPQEVAAQAAVHARAILLADMRGRRKLYERLGRPYDATVDVAAVEGYYAALDRGESQP